MMRRLEMMLGNLKMTLFDLCQKIGMMISVSFRVCHPMLTRMLNHECTRRCC